MKATLTFNLDDSDDAIEHFRCIKSLDMALFIFDFAAKLKDLTDTSEDGKHIDEAHIWEKWEETMEAYDLNLNRLVL
jgi:hypothetical protein